MRVFSFVLAGLIGLAATAAVMGCTPTTAPVAQQTCPAGAPWIPDGYANGKWAPGHCYGYAAQ